MSIDTPEAVTRFAAAVGNLSAELLAVGVSPDALAAGLRIEAARVESRGPKPDMTTGERELIDLTRKAHEFINTLQVAGIPEQVAVTVICHVLIERIARASGASGAANWLRGLAGLVDQNGDTFEATARAH